MRKVGTGVKERIEWIDWIKGVALVLVIIGHTFRTSMYDESMAYSYIKSFIYAFHMPLFIAISGFLFKMGLKKYIATNTLDFVKTRVGSYMKPLISYAVIIYTCFSAVSLVPGVRKMIGGGVQRI